MWIPVLKELITKISGVQGGGKGGRLPPPLKNSGQTLFSGLAQVAQKILEDEKYFNTVKNFRTNSVFQGKRRLFKILNDKKHIFNTVNSGHTLFFRARTSCSKILNLKTIFNTVKYFRKNSVLRASSSSSKIVISMPWKFSRPTLFSGKRKLFKILKDEKYIQYSEFRTHCFSGQAKVAQTSWM